MTSARTGAARLRVEWWAATTARRRRGLVTELTFVIVGQAIGELRRLIVVMLDIVDDDEHARTPATPPRSVLVA